MPPAALLDAARCLAIDGSAESRRALARLRARAPAHVRRLLGKLPRKR
jgi:hypothetical protein